MTDRRPMGALEAEVLDVLWASDAPLTPADVLQQLGDDLAYTTVMTILTRLWQKGLVDRSRRGRAYAYRATVSEAELTATRMHTMLAATSDRAATMSQFVDGLSKKEAAALRSALKRLGS